MQASAVGSKRPLQMQPVKQGGLDAPVAAKCASPGDRCDALEAVSRFCEIPQCRRLAILRHFGEPSTHLGCQLACGQVLCDFCARPDEVKALTYRAAESAPDRGRCLDSGSAGAQKPAAPLSLGCELGAADSSAYYIGVAGRFSGTQNTDATHHSRWSSTGIGDARRLLRTERERGFYGQLPSTIARSSGEDPEDTGAVAQAPPQSGAARLQLRLALLRQSKG